MIDLDLGYKKNKLSKTLYYASRDMLHFEVLEQVLGIVSPLHFVYEFLQKYLLYYILLSDHVSLSDCLHFLRYWAICELQVLVNQAVTS